MTDFYIGQTTGNYQSLDQYRGDLLMWHYMSDGALDAPLHVPQGSVVSVKHGDWFGQSCNVMREGTFA
jgi:hypothetical protein